MSTMDVVADANTGGPALPLNQTSPGSPSPTSSTRSPTTYTLAPQSPPSPPRVIKETQPLTASPNFSLPRAEGPAERVVPFNRRGSRDLCSSHSASGSVSTTRSQSGVSGHYARVYPGPDAAPIPPPHRDTQGRIWGPHSTSATDSSLHSRQGSDPAADGTATAAGGVSAVAMTVADAFPRDSGVEAMRNTPAYDRREMYPYDDVFARPPIARGEVSSGSRTPLGPNAMPPGLQTPTSRSTASVARSFHSDNPYSDNLNPYSRRQSRNLEELDPSIGFDPNSIADDGDNGLHYGHAGRRTSMLSLGHTSDQPRGAAGGAGAKGGMLSSIGALMGGHQRSGEYQAAANAENPPPPPPAGPAYNLNGEKGGASSGEPSQKRRKRIILVIAAILVVGAIVGGIAGGLLASNHGGKSNKSSGPSAASDSSKNGDLDMNSAEIKKLMNNPNLHKVFPGIDYTPLNSQYPDCQDNPLSQNNFTRDLAVLSQLTNDVRLYGTDCHQTEMLMHSIDRLGMNDTIKVWLGLWVDDNEDTNQRQQKQLYQILDDYDESHFLGIIVGNEVLFRKQKTISELIEIIGWVRNNVTSRGMKLPVATSDLGDSWTQELASNVDYVMSNIHPFFAGTPVDDAAEWTVAFWENHNVPLTTDRSKQIIAETGWPTGGGTDCGGASSCTNGAVAGIDELNKFMADWVCQAMANGTDYFWFEAFDEPWKVRYNEAGKEWEDKWGLLTVDRQLKDGVTIPDCGGKTV